MKRILYIMLLLPGIFLSVNGQDIASHQWKERVLVVMTTDTSTSVFKEQVALFKKNASGLQERKLLIYLADPDGYRTFNGSDNRRVPNHRLYTTFKERESELEQLLIGLDGEFKNRWPRVVTMQELFVTIDGMPMRQSEKQNRMKREN